MEEELPKNKNGIIILFAVLFFVAIFSALAHCYIDGNKKIATNNNIISDAKLNNEQKIKKKCNKLFSFNLKKAD